MANYQVLGEQPYHLGVRGFELRASGVPMPLVEKGFGRAPDWFTNVAHVALESRSSSSMGVGKGSKGSKGKSVKGTGTKRRRENR